MFNLEILFWLWSVVLDIVILFINMGFKWVIGVIVLVFFIWNLMFSNLVIFFCVGNFCVIV